MSKVDPYTLKQIEHLIKQLSQLRSEIKSETLARKKAVSSKNPNVKLKADEALKRVGSSIKCVKDMVNVVGFLKDSYSMVSETKKFQNLNSKIEGLCRAINTENLAKETVSRHKQSDRSPLKLKQDEYNSAKDNLQKHRDVVALAIKGLKIVEL